VHTLDVTIMEGVPMETTTFDLSAPYTTSSADVAQYHKDGHIVLRGVLSPDEVEYYRPIIVKCAEEAARTRDMRVQLEDMSTLFTQVSNVWRRSEEARTLIFAKRFARIAADLMGVRGVRLYHDQVLLKEPGGTRTPWHKDHYYWPLATHETIKMTLALSDVAREMGAVVAVTGSHRGGLFPEVPFSLNTQEIFSRVIRTHNIPTVTYDMNPGDALFHSGQLLHSALENTSKRRRELLSVIYYADGTLVAVPTCQQRIVEMIEFLPGLHPGELAASDLNPILYEA
jgi:ectoine hydroxylase-related dioxygenase (phytanoyl-CoA dioxygenase family)